MRPNVKALTHWVIYKHYKVRFKERTAKAVTGILTTPEGEVPFTYDPQTMSIRLPSQDIVINEHGWEVQQGAGRND